MENKSVWKYPGRDGTAGISTRNYFHLQNALNINPKAHE